MRREAVAKPAIPLAGHWIESDLIRERELPLRVPARDMLAMGAARLGESVIEKSPTRASQPAQDSIEGRLALFIFIEAEIQKVVNEARGLRRREGVDVGHSASERVRRAEVIRLRAPQKSYEVAQACKGEARDQRVFRSIGEFVEPSVLKWRSRRQKANRARIHVFPVFRRDRHGPIRVENANGEARRNVCPASPPDR